MGDRRNRRARHRRHKDRNVRRGKMLRGAMWSRLLAPHIRTTLRWVPVLEWLERKGAKP